jgi:hypothetical protein
MSGHARLVRRAVTIAVVLTIALGSAAAGATHPGKPVKVVPTGCRFSSVVWTGGVARGFTQCGGLRHLHYVTGKGNTAFLRRVVHKQVWQMLDVADDGTATYLLYIGGRGHTQARLLIRSHTGKVKDQLLGPVYEHVGNYGSVVATKGKWWAVWTEPGRQSGLWQAHTMGSNTVAHLILTKTPGQIFSPDLTVLSSTTVGMVWSQGRYPGCDTIDWGRSSGAVSWTRSSNLRACGMHPAVSHGGGIWRIAWLNGGDVMFADHASGHWVKRLLSTGDTQSAGDSVSLAVIRSTVAVGWTTKDANGQSRGVLDVRRAGHWTNTLIDTDIRADVIHESVAAVGLSGSQGGHSQILLSDNDTPDRYYVVRRQ